MRVACTVVIIFLLVFPGITQTNQRIKFFCSYGEANHGIEVCQEQQMSFASNYHAERAVDKILKPLGVKSNFVLVACPNIANAMAITFDDGLRYIVYDNAFMEEIDKDSNTNWASISILAHEIGHHLSGHTTLRRGDLSMTAYLERRRKNELEADEFSGFAMFKLGATLVQAQAAMMSLDDVDDPEENYDHPKKWRRLEAIKTGYMDAKSQQPPPSGRGEGTARGSIDGVWVGRVWQEATGAVFYFAMKLEQNGNSAIGQAVAQAAIGGYLGQWDISVTEYSNSILFKDLAITRSTMPPESQWCIKEGRLNYDRRTNRIYGVIDGYSTTSFGLNTPCPKISFDLHKQ